MTAMCPAILVAAPASGQGKTTVASALARLHAEHGPVAVSVATQEGPLLQEWMAAQRFDLGLTELGEAPPGTRVLSLPAMDEVAVLPARHPLAARPVLGAQDFAGQPFISLARAQGDGWGCIFQQLDIDGNGELRLPEILRSAAGADPVGQHPCR